MSIRMAKLTRSNTGDFVSRKGIPADVRAAYTRLYRESAKAPLRITRAGGRIELTVLRLGRAITLVGERFEAAANRVAMWAGNEDGELSGAVAWPVTAN